MRPGDYRSNNDLYWRKAFGFELSVKRVSTAGASQFCVFDLAADPGKKLL
jgi:hypothetical protein